MPSCLSGISLCFLCPTYFFKFSCQEVWKTVFFALFWLPVYFDTVISQGVEAVTYPGQLETQISHSIAFVGDNFLSHFAHTHTSLSLLAPSFPQGAAQKTSWHFGELGSTTQHLQSTGAASQAHFMHLSSKHSQHQLFAGAFYLPSGLLRL